MKKAFAILAACGLLFSLAGTAAAAPKPPKKICLEWTGSSFITALVIKSAGGNIKLADGKTKFYTISGELRDVSLPFSAPVKGSGHMDGNIFHFMLKGYTKWSSNFYSVSMEGFLDVTTMTGTGNWSYIYHSGSGTTVNLLSASTTLAEMDCSAFQIPYSPQKESGEPLGLPGLSQ